MPARAQDNGASFRGRSTHWGSDCTNNYMDGAARRRSNLRESAPGEEENDRADQGVDGYPFEQPEAGGKEKERQDQHRSDDGEDLLDTPLASADPRDVLGNRRAATRAGAAPLHDQLGFTAWAFYAGPNRHAPPQAGAFEPAQ